MYAKTVAVVLSYMEAWKGSTVPASATFLIATTKAVTANDREAIQG